MTSEPAQDLRAGPLEAGGRHERADGAQAGFGLYVHWPFCRAKCPYCDFNSYVAEAIEQGRWRRAYLAELERVAAETSGRRLRSVYFGGGTPSLMDPETVAELLAAARRLWRWEREVEVTLEANPGSCDPARLRAFRDAGVNRLSLGVQALDEEGLRRLGRTHDVATAIRAAEAGRRIFPILNLDLIYARPGQSLGGWMRELERALLLEPDHLSAYELTIEPGTPFARQHRAGRLSVPGEDRRAVFARRTLRRLEEAGFACYEVSNFARPGRMCRHNLIYWRAGDWLGIGPGAHGRLSLCGDRIATRAVRAPGTWLRAVEERGCGELVRERLGPREAAVEYAIMALRLAEGLDLDRLAGFLGAPWEELLDPEAVERLVEAGLLVLEDSRLCASAQGWLRLDALVRAILR